MNHSVFSSFSSFLMQFFFPPIFTLHIFSCHLKTRQLIYDYLAREIFESGDWIYFDRSYFVHCLQFSLPSRFEIVSLNFI